MPSKKVMIISVLALVLAYMLYKKYGSKMATPSPV